MSSTPLTAPKQRIPIRVYILLAIGLMSFAFSPIMVRLAQGENVPSLLIASSRLTIAALLLTPLVWQRYRSIFAQLTGRDWLLIGGSGVFLAIHFASWVTSLEYTSVLLSVVFVTSSPIWVALMEFFFLKTRLHRFVIIGLLVAVTGGLLIGFAGEVSGTASSESDLIGGALSLIGAVAMAGYLTIGRKVRTKMPVIPYIWLVYGSAGLILLLIVLATGIPLTGYSLTGYGWLIGLAVFPQLFGHSSLNYAVGFLPATLVSMITQLESVGSAIIAYFLFSELPAPVQILGSGIIIAGIMLANLGQGRQEAN